MFQRAGVSKKERGAYAHEIRYAFDSNTQTWIAPVDGDGAAFTGGTWDLSELITEQDLSLALKLTGIGLDETAAAASATALQIGHSYLMSRSSMKEDTNLESSETPAAGSILNALLRDSIHNPSIMDNVVNEAQDAQDNLPYELLVADSSGDVNHDITEPVELGRLIAQACAPISEVIIDVPFGIFEVKAQHFDAGDTMSLLRWLMHLKY